MQKIVSIYEAKTNLSKFIKKAEAGETIYVGAYGRAQAVIAPLPERRQIKIGVWAKKKRLGSYEYDGLVGSGSDPAAEHNSSSRKISVQ